MRWCANNFWCRFIHRHFFGISLTLLLLLCANQVLQINIRSDTSECYQIVSPFGLAAGHDPNNTLLRSRFGRDLASQLGNRSEELSDVILPSIQWAQARFDNRMMLRIYEWTWTGELWGELMSRFSVCLATQCSVDRIASIAEVSEKWLGPISLGVYVRTADEWSVLVGFMAYMQRCSALFTQTVSVHLVTPREFNENSGPGDKLAVKWKELGPQIIDHPCGQPQAFLLELMKNVLPKGMNKSALYPQNHMRNIARKTCGTPYVFMTDVDIIPRPNASSMVHKFLQSPAAAKCSKCAFVIPVFELMESLPYPTTKRQLISYVNKAQARQFHLKIYRFGHWATNYSNWVKTNLEEEDVKISHPVDSRMNHYEPFYISSDKIPPHDERFVGYGFTRSSQVLEARVKGWRFFVLTPIYSIHWGLQTPMTNKPVPPSGPKTPLQYRQLRIGSQSSSINPRKLQNSFNQIIYNDFVTELMAKHNISVARSKSQLKKKRN